jgi:hypothetical protein
MFALLYAGMKSSVFMAESCLRGTVQGGEGGTGVSKEGRELPLFCFFLAAFAKFRKATISLVKLVCPSVCIEQFGSHWTDFHKI